jgi:hypothetical protein
MERVVEGVVKYKLEKQDVAFHGELSAQNPPGWSGYK